MTTETRHSIARPVSEDFHPEHAMFAIHFYCKNTCRHLEVLLNIINFNEELCTYI